MIRSFLIAAVIGSGSLCSATGEDAAAQIFDATIHSIKSIREHRGTAVKTNSIPFFVATLELDRAVDGLGKKGEKVDVAIHSPARDFRMADYKSYKYPLKWRFSLSKLQPSGALFLEGIGTKAQHPPDGKPQEATQPPH